MRPPKSTERVSVIDRVAEAFSWTLEPRYDWTRVARPKQLAPNGSWRVWLILAGRGFGKTRTGAEWVRKRVNEGAMRITIAGATAGDLRDIMIEGESGLLSVFPESQRPTYEPSKLRVTFHTGAIATLRSADEPDRFRGLQSDTAWCDEIAAWRYGDAFDQILFGMRLGKDPRLVATTTPRPVELVRRLMRDSATMVTRGSTYENRANLAPAFFDAIVKRYEGTRLGRQELDAELLDDMPGALWKRAQIDALRVENLPELRKVVVAIDPAIADPTARTEEQLERAAETGIVVAGLGTDGHGYVIADYSGRHTPEGWARVAVDAYRKHEARRIIAEENQGGAMVEHTIRSVWQAAPYEGVHAAKGKRARAEPIAALYEQGRVHHVGCLPELEDQLCTWDAVTSTKSPDRLDAMVWALTHLIPCVAPTARGMGEDPLLPF